jgi:hypothetical protein
LQEKCSGGMHFSRHLLEFPFKPGKPPWTRPNACVGYACGQPVGKKFANGFNCAQEGGSFWSFKVSGKQKKRSAYPPWACTFLFCSPSNTDGDDHCSNNGASRLEQKFLIVACPFLHRKSCRHTPEALTLQNRTPSLISGTIERDKRKTSWKMNDANMKIWKSHAQGCGTRKFEVRCPAVSN